MSETTPKSVLIASYIIISLAVLIPVFWIGFRVYSYKSALSAYNAHLKYNAQVEMREEQQAQKCSEERDANIQRVKNGQDIVFAGDCYSAGQSITYPLKPGFSLF